MKKIRGLINKKTILVVVLLVVIILAGLGVYVFKQNSGKDSKTSSAAQITNLVQKVGKIIDLPTDETPTIATVSDITKLKGQAFFAKAQNGDKVLVFTKTKKAILYRPGANKIIEVAVYNPTSAAGTPTPVNQTVKVALYNGTTTVGLTKITEASLVKKYPNITVVDKENASKSDYKKTIIVSFSGNTQMAQTLASEFGGEVGSLPSGETKPAGADILVILGSK